MNGKVVYLYKQDRPMRSILLPQHQQPRRRWRWNWRRAAKNLLVTVGLIAVWLIVLVAMTGGW